MSTGGLVAVRSSRVVETAVGRRRMDKLLVMGCGCDPGRMFVLCFLAPVKLLTMGRRLVQ